MIQRDYILRMIEEFMQALARIRRAKQQKQWDEASGDLNTEFKRLIGANFQTALEMSETELLARIIRGEPTHLVRNKIFMLATLLKEAGDVALARDQTAEWQTCYLKSLHLLLDTVGRDDIFECPEFVPKVHLLTEALASTPLPTRTHAMLMQHFERTGEFAKAEDSLHAMLEADPENSGIVEFGVAYYQRLLGQSDSMLAGGGLPRFEVEEGLKELRHRRIRSDLPK
ncbi:MAG: hypothetical protein H7X97_00450 [Opitutaceae bacterium]|nr:hypothetical protein [Verrucomicrobiales bacterium]